MPRLTHELDAAWLALVDKLYDIERDLDKSVWDHAEFLFHVGDVFGDKVEDDYNNYYMENENG